tara:strand:- start:437 stop:583 length:147 start_codon:yes stop_codon:yes gene_type:complete
MYATVVHSISYVNQYSKTEWCFGEELEEIHISIFPWTERLKVTTQIAI